MALIWSAPTPRLALLPAPGKSRCLLLPNQPQ
jgi:hypothetical protein